MTGGGVFTTAASWTVQLRTHGGARRWKACFPSPAMTRVPSATAGARFQRVGALAESRILYRNDGPCSAALRASRNADLTVAKLGTTAALEPPGCQYESGLRARVLYSSGLRPDSRVRRTDAVPPPCAARHTRAPGLAAGAQSGGPLPVTTRPMAVDKGLSFECPL